MSLKDKIKQDLIEALKSKDELARSTLRMLLAEIGRKEIETLKKEEGLTDAEIQEVVMREIKKRNEAVAQYRSGGRKDLADSEKAEADILRNYAPQQISDKELEALVEKIIKETGAKGPADMGSVMARVMAGAGANIDGAKANAMTRSALSQITSKP